MKLPFMVIFFACTLVGLGAAMPRSFQRDWYEHGDWSGNDGSYKTLSAWPVELHLFVAPSSGNHYLTTTDNNPGPPWKDEGVIGQVFKTPQEGTIPLSRYYSTRVTRYHYGTTTVPDFGDGDLRYQMAGIVGYAYALPKEGTIPLYQWYNKEGTKSHTVSTKFPGFTKFVHAPQVLAYIFPK